MSQFELAEANIARIRAPLEDPMMADFVAGLQPINALADAAPGFIWRLQTEAGDATAVRAFEDPTILLNLSVWRSVEDLRDFMYRTGPAAFLQQRKRWFVPLEQPSTMLFWVASGHRPTPEEALAKFELLWAQGPSPAAFTFSQLFPPPA